MIYGSVCSGIEAATVAWAPLGWRCAFMSEIEAFPRAVLTHHYPETPLHGDFTSIEAGAYEAIDLLVGGTPCQSFSVAGLRGGLDDDRGNLALEYLRLVDRLRPRWLVWENVPGVLSSNGGRDFGSILGGMGELRYGVAYRVLDAQFFGVAQRRRRVFVVGYLGDWRRAAAVLFERHCLSGHPAPSREKGPGVAALTANGVGTCGADDNQAQAGHLIAGTLNANGKAAGSATQQDAESGLLITHSLRGEGFDASEDGTGRGTPLVAVAHLDVLPTMQNGADTPAGHSARSGHTKDNYIVPVTFALRGREGGAMPEVGDGNVSALRAASGGSTRDYVAFDLAQITSAANRTRVDAELPASTLNAKGQMHVAGVTVHGTDKTATAASMTETAGSIRTKPPGSIENSSTTAALHGSAVRRLTPVECERLQGFSDGYTDIPWRGKEHAPDGPRYKALGNSMAVPCMVWIGQRIQQVEAIHGA